jgi:hypothetical protein
MRTASAAIDRFVDSAAADADADADADAQNRVAKRHMQRHPLMYEPSPIAVAKLTAWKERMSLSC